MLTVSNLYRTDTESSSFVVYILIGTDNFKSGGKDKHSNFNVIAVKVWPPSDILILYILKKHLIKMFNREYQAI